MLTQTLEHRSQPLLTRRQFVSRMAWTAAKIFMLMGGGLGLGILGYHHFEGLPWIDALLEASMILGGMGPCHPPQLTAGKLFASFYALFSGILFLSMSAVFLAPVVHRVLHRLHLQTEDSASENENGG